MALLYIKQIMDMVKNEIRNHVLHKVATAPGTPVEGQVWYDTAAQHLKYQNVSVAVDPHDRATHTGTQTASTISDFTTAVRSNTLNQMAAPTAAVSMNSQKITSLATATGAGEAVEYAQMNTAISTALATATAGITYKAPVRAATTANITLSGTQTIDGVALTAGQRVLVKNQTTTSQNGLYLVAAGAWTRTTDADSAAELEGGVVVPVDEGTTQADTVWMLTTDVVTLGTDAITFSQFGAGSTYTASLGVQLVGNDIRANLGTGMTLSGNQAVPDFGSGANKVMRAKIAVGFVPSGSVDATVNHGLALANKDDYLCEVVEVGVGRVLCGEVSVDTNNLTLSFATAPTTNQYRYKILGLS